MTKRAKTKDAARKLAIDAARLARDRNCEEILVLDLREISPVTDYFVIATGTSGRQLRSIAEEMADHGKKIGQKVWHVDGADASAWIVMDFVDVVVHLFNEELRRYYDLELIWGEAPRVPWQEPAAPSRR